LRLEVFSKRKNQPMLVNNKYLALEATPYVMMWGICIQEIGSWNTHWKYSPIDDATLQNFIYKHITNFENVQRNKKKEEGRFIKRLSSD
jgi:hypothetical protein